jgi:hypothetical protein
MSDKTPIVFIVFIQSARGRCYHRPPLYLSGRCVNNLPVVGVVTDHQYPLNTSHSQMLSIMSDKSPIVPIQFVVFR